MSPVRAAARLAVAAVLLTGLAPPAAAAGAPPPLVPGDSFTARGLIVCLEQADAILIAEAINAAPNAAADLGPEHPAHATLSRLMFEGACAQFDAWMQFVPEEMVQAGAAPDGARAALLYNVVAAHFTLGEGPQRLFLITERPLTSARR